LHIVLGKIYYKGLNFTTQAVLVLALHIVLGKIYYKGLNFMMAKPIEKSPGCEPRPGTAWSTFPCA